MRRATLTIDDDNATGLAGLARASGKPFEMVVNEVLRRGLCLQHSEEMPFRIAAHPGGLRPGIDDRRFNELAGELDDQTAAKLERKR